MDIPNGLLVKLLASVLIGTQVMHHDEEHAYEREPKADTTVWQQGVLRMSTTNAAGILYSEMRMPPREWS
jgi:hypothetical protein